MIRLNYEGMDDYSKALEYYKKVLIIKESMLGSEHPDIAITYGNIASVYEDMRNYDNCTHNNNGVKLLQKH